MGPIEGEEKAPHCTGRDDQDLTPQSLLTHASIESEGQDTTTQDPSDLWQRMRLGFRLAAPDDPRIQRELARFTAHLNTLESGIKRAEPYLHFIVEETERRGMPLEIALLPAIESGFRPDARSPHQAMGLWQFIPSTAKAMGLKRNWWYEGRCDITASTRAALDYLKSLAEQFDGDWELALAAYNAGPGTVQRAIHSNQKKGLATDFWSLPLPDETRQYVPRLLAIAQIMGNPDAHGLDLQPLADKPYFKAVEVPHPIDLRQAAKLAQVDQTTLSKLNPGLRRSTTGPEGDYSLLLPVEHATQFKRRLAQLEPRQWVALRRHYRVRRGDTLSRIARRLGVSRRALREANGLVSHRLRSGQKLIVPPTAKRRPQLADAKTKTGQDQGRTASAASKAPVPRSRKAVDPVAVAHRVRRGESLSKIARIYRVSPTQLAAWNNLSLKSTLHPGQRLHIYSLADIAGGQSFTYKVRKGDSLYRIARRFKVSVADLRRWNQLNDDDLQPGKQLTLRRGKPLTSSRVPKVRAGYLQDAV